VDTGKGSLSRPNETSCSAIAYFADFYHCLGADKRKGNVVKHTRLVNAILLLICCFVLGGCVWFQSLLPEGRPSDNELLDSYYRTVVKLSTSADVLASIQGPPHGLLSQSESVIASWGQKKKGYKAWFNIVAFHEDQLTAQRKYFFIEDERPRSLPALPKQKLRFDTEMVLEEEFLDQPFATENARRIAILQHVLEVFKQDIEQVSQDNVMLEASGTMVNQSFSRILQILEDMPVLASKLTELDGLDFDHIVLGKGKIRMVIRDDIVKVKIKIGSITNNFKRHKDVLAM
jgi:hypothetical protein